MKYFVIAFITLLSSVGLAQPENRIDAKGKKQGEWGKLYPDSRVYQYRGQFKDGKPVGKFTYFYLNQKVRAVIVHDENSNRSEAYFYHETGKIMSHGIYRDMKKDSIWVNFDPHGRLSTRESYKSDSLHGRKEIYILPKDPYDKRQVLSAEYNYINGSLEGAFKEYFEFGGVKKVGRYENNRPDGLWIHYHPNGKRMLVERYYQGALHGWMTGYDKEGKEVNSVYYYFGKKLEGEKLEGMLKQMKEKGIDPNFGH